MIKLGNRNLHVHVYTYLYCISNCLGWCIIKKCYTTVFLISSYGAQLAQRASYLALHCCLSGPDGTVNYHHIVANFLLIGSIWPMLQTISKLCYMIKPNNLDSNLTIYMSTLHLHTTICNTTLETKMFFKSYIRTTAAVIIIIQTESNETCTIVTSDVVITNLSTTRWVLITFIDICGN